MSTIDYYDKNAEMYFDYIVNADMSDNYQRFLIYLPQNSFILDAALPMHQQSSILNFIPRCRLTLQSLVTSKVLVNVTIGMGDFVHSSKAMALLVSLGLISCFILLFVFDCKVTNSWGIHQISGIF